MVVSGIVAVEGVAVVPDVVFVVIVIFCGVLVGEVVVVVVNGVFVVEEMMVVVILGSVNKHNEKTLTCRNLKRGRTQMGLYSPFPTVTMTHRSSE